MYEPGAAYAVTGAADPIAVADDGGRLHLVVDLGPSHQAEQFTPTARAVQDLPGYMATRTVTIAPAPVAPLAGARPVVAGSVVTPEQSRSAGGGRLPVTGAAVATGGATILLLAAGALLSVLRRASAH